MNGDVLERHTERVGLMNILLYTSRGSSVLRKDFVLIVGSSTETMYNS
jgi:hypothetical protein